MAELLTPEQQEKIKSAISQAEAQTSGEIRLFIENGCKEETLDRAAFIFKKLEMHKTDLRNGVLFYLAVNDHKFAIIGDAGINSKVPEDFWNMIKAVMEQHFKRNEFAEGLRKGISMAGEALQKHFPFTTGDKNELSDDIIFGDGK